MKLSKFLFFLVVLTGCVSIQEQSESNVSSETEIKPLIEFISKTDMLRWDESAIDVRWGIAISRENITTTVKDGWTYNEPVFDIPTYKNYIAKNKIESFNKISFSIDSGIHDWLILIDLDNNGSWDSYLGSAEEHIKLNQINFKNGFVYSVVVGEDSIPKLEIKPNTYEPFSRQ